MTDRAELSERFEAWERREDAAEAALPYVMLAVATALSVAVQDHGLLVDIVLAAAAGAWMLWMVTLHPEWRERPGIMGVYVSVLVALMAVLVWHAPWFGFFTFTGYFAAVRLPGRWRIPGVLGVAGVTAASQAGGWPGASAGDWALYALILAVNAGVAGTMIWFSFVGFERSAWRAAAIDELTAVNRRLEESLHENAHLQERLVGQARASGVAEERGRMAREIHDTLAQGLAGIITQLQAASGAAAGSDGWRRHHEAAMRLARESLSEARRSVAAMRPEPLEAARLPEALAGVVADWSQLSGIAGGVTTTGVVRPMRPEIEVTLLRTAQEALANVAKHAGATRVGLTLSYMEDVVTLDVRDDGVGFLPAGCAAPGPDGGYGLVAMRQRVDRLAGRLEIESEPGGGTAISASMPAVPA
jgi:signal transduction histidine kinase